MCCVCVDCITSDNILNLYQRVFSFNLRWYADHPDQELSWFSSVPKGNLLDDLLQYFITTSSTNSSNFRMQSSIHTTSFQITSTNSVIMWPTICPYSTIFCFDITFFCNNLSSSKDDMNKINTMIQRNKCQHRMKIRCSYLHSANGTKSWL